MEFMMKNLIYLLLILVFASCGRRLDEVVIKNEQGAVVEKYYLDKDSLKFGAYTSYDEDGVLFEESQYRNGVLDGTRKIYFPDGGIEISENYEKGQIAGLYETYYNNGQVNLVAEYVDGKMEGIVKRYYETGELMEEVTFVANEENGPFREFYKNGQVKWEGEYKDGDNEFGLIKSYDENGQLVKKMECGKYQGEYICQTVWTLEEGDKALVLPYEE